MAASAADLATLRTEIKEELQALYNGRLAAMDSTLQGVEATRLIQVDQLTQMEATRFAMEAKIGMIEQTISDMSTWRQTVDDAAVNFVLKHDAAEAGRRIEVLERAAAEGGKGKGGEKGGWQMTRPKDMLPDVLKSPSEWAGWKDSVEDYAEKIRPGTKTLMKMVSKCKLTITESVVKTAVDGGLPESFNEGQWEENTALYELLKLKTAPGTEARTIVTNAEREGGFEAWRNLSIMYEPQQGIRRMKEIAELSALQNKRCKNRQETSLILLDI